MTEISALGEFGLIKRLTQDIKTTNNATLYGVGDDCAVLHYPDNEVLVTTDMLMEGVHFDLTYIDMYHLGFKSAQVNISDVFAMNGTPRQLIVSLASLVPTPPHPTQDWLLASPVLAKHQEAKSYIAMVPKTPI